MTQLFKARELEGDSMEEKGIDKRFKQIMRITFCLKVSITAVIV